MIDTKHTPGPWEIVCGGQPGDDGFTIMARNGHGVLAECWPPGVTAEERQTILANARLIAAAPDLLAAAITLVANHNKPGGHFHLEPLWLHVESAIAKATYSL